MEQNKKLKMSTLILIITIVVLIGALIVLLYLNQKQGSNSEQTIVKLQEQQKQSESDKQTIVALQKQIADLQKEIENTNKQDNGNTNKEIALTNAEKIAINAGLNYPNESLNYALRYMLNETNGATNIGLSKIEYNTNMLSKEINQYYLVWTTMTSHGAQLTKGEATGKMAIEVEKLKTYYQKILGMDINEQAIQAANINGVSIKDGKLYGTIVTAWGGNPISLKAKSLMLDETTKTYTLKVDFLYDENNDIESEENNYAGQYDTLTYSNSLIKAELEIKYQEKDNGDKIVTSLIFKK